MTLRNSFLMLALGGLLRAGFAADVTIVNPSFEDDFAAPGTYPGLVPNGWSVLDPNGILDGGADLTGVVNPTGTLFFPGGAPDGSNAGYIYLAGDIEGGPVSYSQVLSATLQANTAYRLEVEVGNIASDQGFDLEGFPGYTVQLLAGGVVLAQDANSLSIPDGTFMTSTVQYASGSGDPLLGQNLEIRLTNLNMRSSVQHPGIEVDFDMARLDATPVPEPASLVVGLAGILALRRRRK